MLPAPAIAVVHHDLAQRVAVVEAVSQHGLQAYAVVDPERLIVDGRLPRLVLLFAACRADLEDATRLLGTDGRLRSVPLVVVAPAEADYGAVDAFALGAADFVTDETELGELCARLGARLERSRRVTELQRFGRSAEMVLEITQALSSTLELRELLFTVVRRIAEVVEIDRVSIVLGGGDDDTAYVIAASDDEQLRDLAIKISDYPEIAQTIASGEPLQITDATRHPLFDLSDVHPPRRFRSLTLFPILFEDRPMGVLFLRRERPGDLGRQSMFFLRAVANATGIALRNARLLQTLRDQTRRSRFEHFEVAQQLRSLQRYADYFDSSADGIIVVSHDGQVMFCNPAACAITGRSIDELRQGGFEPMLTRDGRERYQEVERGFADGIFPHNVDLSIRTPWDERRVLNVSFNSVLREDSGGVIVSLRDVTEDRALERELTKTKEFLQRVIDSSVDAIVSADMRGRVLLFNPAAESTYGYSADQVVGGMNVRDLYPEGVARQVMRLIRSDELGPSGVLQGYETELLGQGGARIPVMLSAALIMHRGRAIGSVGVFRDLRARRSIEQRLATAQQELAVTEQKAFIAELAGATAHELNQPLTAVMGYAGLLARHVQGEERLSQLSARIVTEAERMAEIVRKIGKLTRYETKAYVGETKIIDIDRSIDIDPSVTEY